MPKLTTTEWRRINDLLDSMNDPEAEERFGLPGCRHRRMMRWGAAWSTRFAVRTLMCFAAVVNFLTFVYFNMIGRLLSLGSSDST